jgi:toxin ParE1/3/4
VRVEFHPAVADDLADVLQRYDAVSEHLGEEFKAEFLRVVAMAAANPNRFHPIKPGFHRANLKRFPYHFIYREMLRPPPSPPSTIHHLRFA